MMIVRASVVMSKGSVLDAKLLNQSAPTATTTLTTTRVRATTTNPSVEG